MDLPNLATVIGPSILFSAGRDPAFEFSFGVIRVVTELLENQDEFFTVPEDFLPLVHDQEHFAHSMELPSKDLMKKCETYMRQKSSGRSTGPLMSPVSNSSPFNSNNANLAHLNRSGDLLDSRWVSCPFDFFFFITTTKHVAVMDRHQHEAIGRAHYPLPSPKLLSGMGTNHGNSPRNLARPSYLSAIRLQVD